ncbi:MAG: bifunctional hydroxymethylpyrimidine kinase/phosphomethylpyrimidine kinase [Lachnospiraceae bacterium]|nr:bifunctional hydroxymethylpyrimidine kinase/phosphomethylpyrimidine kinase [Lachnospiraceae bacterium]
MKCTKENFLLYAVTGGARADGMTLYEQAEAALRGGATCLQLRDKTATREELLAEAKELAELCHRYGALFIVNDSAEVAIASGADGVHVGLSDMAVSKVRELAGNRLIIGASAHSVAEARAAVSAGADYLGVGAMYETATKTDTHVLPHAVLGEITHAVDVPVVAIGGITKENLSKLLGFGQAGVALVGAIFGAPDIEAAARELRKLSERAAYGMRTALTIAGSDSSGGAGIQADIKTMTANGVYAMSAITALTAQNTTGVESIFPVTPEFLAAQMDSIFRDIEPDAVKIGMVANSELIRVIAAKLREYKATDVVVDPVMVATSGSSLMQSEAVATLVSELLPLARLATPNIPEAEVLSGMKITDEASMEVAAAKIAAEAGCAVLLKGGHRVLDASDYLFADGQGQWFRGERIDNPNTHGTGCTLSSAIASFLAQGYPLPEAVARAKRYLTGALAAMLDLGSGSGPMNHAYAVGGFAAE